MKNLTAVLGVVTLLMASLSMSMSASANDSKKDGNTQAQKGIAVTWGDFDDFRDVRTATEPKDSFHKRVKSSFDKFFNNFFVDKEQQLPPGQSLAIEIKDLDLAGEVFPGSRNDMRIMKDLSFPRMRFGYTLTDANGKVLKQGEASIKDMSYLYQQKTWKRYSQGFYYEKRMFREWFEDTFSKS